MKALTIWQPWASLIACGAKRIETRSWATKHRGPLAIHAGKNGQYVDNRFEGCPLGAVIAVVDLVDCIEMTEENIAQLPEQERGYGHYEPGRVMWMLENIRKIEPVPATGRQGLWNWEE